MSYIVHPPHLGPPPDPSSALIPLPAGFTDADLAFLREIVDQEDIEAGEAATTGIPTQPKVVSRIPNSPCLL